MLIGERQIMLHDYRLAFYPPGEPVMAAQAGAAAFKNRREGRPGGIGHARSHTNYGHARGAAGDLHR